MAAVRTERQESEAALEILDHPARQLLTSAFIRLEVYPKALFHSHPEQTAFLVGFFADPSVEWATDLDAVVILAFSQAQLYGLSAMDALHIAAAKSLGADEFVTAEKPGKPIYRVDGLRIVSVFAPPSGISLS
jgi:predicted nucleic acid-binding protein